MLVYAWRREVRKEHLKGMNVSEEDTGSAIGFVYECFIREAGGTGSLVSGDLNSPIETMLDNMERYISMYDEKRKLTPKRGVPGKLKSTYGSSGPPFRRGEIQDLENGDYGKFAGRVREISA